MDIHEYQAKELLKKFEIPVPEFGVASTLEEVDQITENLMLTKAVLKIQVHAGGRGKAGGVKFANNRSLIKRYAEELLGMKMVNHQTGPQGMVAHKVMISRPIAVAKEFYLGAVIERQNRRATLIASSAGGMEIEEVAEKTPNKILKIRIGLDGSLKPYHLLRLANFMGWKGRVAKKGMEIAEKLARLFTEHDGALLELNPLAETLDGELWALDAKFSVDDNALFRQKEMALLDDPFGRSQHEAYAKEHDLAYLSLEGNIGCMVNGAGLAMATMDLIESHGGKAANFLNVGGGASQEKVAHGFKLILSDPRVKVILVNIFRGIMNCSTLAEGIVAASRELKIQLPLIVRLEGTSVEKGRAILDQSTLRMISVTSMEEAARQAVLHLKGGG